MCSFLLKMLSNIFLFLLVQGIYTYQRRPRRMRPSPLDACESLNPCRGITGQNRTFPYDIIIDPKDHYIGEKVTLTIKGKNPKDKLGGFMVQARQDFNIPFGTFQRPDNGKDMKIINCLSPGTTVTHMKFNHRDKIILTWKPPNLYKGPAVFFVTVIKSRKVIWVAVKSEPFWYMEKRPPPVQLDLL